jgi:DNA topoisomerase III
MSLSESGTIAVVAEKPSVVRDIAKVLEATTRGDGYLHGNGYVVTWAIGHLVSLAQPHEIHPRWKSTKTTLARKSLPVIDRVFRRMQELH